MEEEFTTYASAEVMVSNIPFETAERLARQIAEIPVVSDVLFDDSPSHYRNAAALFPFRSRAQAGTAIPTREKILPCLQACRKFDRCWSPTIPIITQTSA